MTTTQRDWFSSKIEGARWRLSDLYGSMSVAEFDVRTLCAANRIHERFPKRRSRIGLWGENSLDYLIALFAVLRAGNVAAPLNTRYSPQEFADIIGAAALDGLLVSGDFPTKHCGMVGGIPTYPIADCTSSSETRICALEMNELDTQDVAVLMCSSGSSGRPKIVPLTLDSLFHHAIAVCQRLRVTGDDSWIICLPLYHVGGLTIAFRCIVSGASLIFTQSAEAGEINRSIAAEKATLISVVPTVLERMLNARGNESYPKSLRGIIVGGGPVAHALLKRCAQAYATYGLSEAGSMVACARPGCDESERMSAGLALPQTEIKIVEEDGGEVRKGVEGIIVVHGPGMTQGYLGNPEANERTFRSGWIHTGDIGYLDAQGFLHVKARRSDVIISGGENIYPEEIEAAIKDHPQVQTVVVLPLDDPTWGQIPAAFIVPNSSGSISEVSVRRFLDGKLAKYKIPKKIAFAAELPLLSTGKVDLAAIKKLLKS